MRGRNQLPFWICLLTACSGGDPNPTKTTEDLADRADRRVRIETITDGEPGSVEMALKAADDFLGEGGTSFAAELRQACADELEGTMDVSFIDSCGGVPDWLDGSGVPLTSTNFRRYALLSACVGGHYLTMSRTVAPIHLLHVNEDGDERVILTQAPPETVDFVVAHNFTVPPQVPRQQATFAAHALAELHRSATWLGLALNPNVCDDPVYDDGGERLETLGALLAEVVMNIEEAAQLAENRMLDAAQARRAAERDPNRGRILSWRAPLESRLDAANVLHRPEDAFEGHGGLFPVVTAVPQTRSEERAYHLLRDRRVDPSLRGAALRSALLNAMNEDYPSASATPTFGSDADGFLGNVRVDPLELDRAALRLEQEARVLGRAIVEDPATPARFLNVDRPLREVDWAYPYALTEGRVLMDLAEPGITDGLTTDYGMRSVSSLYDYLHYVVHRIRARPLGESQDTFGSLFAYLDSQVEDRARVCWIEADETDRLRPHDRLTLRFHDAPGPESGPQYLVWRGEAGLECAMTGRLGGADVCDETPVRVERTTEVTATPAYNDHGDHMVTLDIRRPEQLVGERIYVTRDLDPAGSRRELLFGMEVQASPYSDDLMFEAATTTTTTRSESERDLGLGLTVRLDAGTDAGSGIGGFWFEGEDGRTRINGFTSGPVDPSEPGWTFDFGFEEPEGPAMQCAFAPLGPVLREGIRRTIAANHRDPAGLALQCAGIVDADLPLKLEDALTEEFTGEDDLESSVAWYLDRARRSATEADRIGEELYAQHLAIDQREESFDIREAGLNTRLDDIAGRIAQLCGGHVDMSRIREAACPDADSDCDLAGFILDVLENEDLVDAYDELGSDLIGLRACLSEDTEWVAVGNRDLCGFRMGDLPICVCDDPDSSACPPCPVLAPDHALGGDDCSDHYSDAGFGGIDGVLIDRRLGIQATDYDRRASASYSDCEALIDLREGTASPASLEWFTEQNVRDAARFLTVHRSATNMAEVRASGRTLLSMADGAGVPKYESWPFCAHPGLNPAVAAQAEAAGSFLGGLWCDPSFPTDGNHGAVADRISRAARILGLFTGAEVEIQNWDEHVWNTTPFNISADLQERPAPTWFAALPDVPDPIERWWESDGWTCWQNDDPKCFASTRTYVSPPMPQIIRAFWAKGGCDVGYSGWEHESTNYAACGAIQHLFDGDSSVPYAEALTPDADVQYFERGHVIDALELACLSNVERDGGCDTMLADPPPIHGPADLANLSAYISCAADAVESKMEETAIRDLPDPLIRALEQNQSRVPELQGSHGQAALAIAGTVQEIVRIAHAATSATRDSALELKLMQSRLKQLDLEDQLSDIQYEASEEAQRLSAISNYIGGIGSSAMSHMSGNKAGPFGALTTLTSTIIDVIAAEASIHANRAQSFVTERIEDEERKQQMLSAILAVLARVDKINDLLTTLRSTLATLESQIEALRSNRAEARRLLNQLQLVEAERDARSVMVDTALSARLDTLQIRYERALTTAKRDTFLAARAIEQRIGESLVLMNGVPEFLEEAPATWAPRICSLTGIDYEKIRARVEEQADAGDYVPSDPGNDYADEYATHMVERLESLMLSYRYEAPFQRGTQTLVLSLRDDIVNAPEPCQVPGPNLLHGTVDLGTGWLAGCTAGGACLSREPMTSAAPDVHTSYIDGSGAYDTRVVTLVPSMGGSGVVFEQPSYYQEVELGGGVHSFSWLEWGSSVEGFVTDETGVELSGDLGCVPLEDGFRHCELRFTPEPGTHRAGFRLLAGATEGEVLAPQLERGFYSSFFATNELLTQPIGWCAQGGDGAFLDHFDIGTEYYCPDGTGVDCAVDDTSGLPHRNYFEHAFTMSPSEFESGSLGFWSGFPSGNFNYRIERVAMVGIDDGDDSQIPCTGAASACARHAQFYYSLDHDGPFEIRNHDNDTFDAHLFPGRIRSAQGEIGPRVGQPTPDPSRLEPILRDELRGRPLSGSFTLRLYEDPRVRWSRMDDIQVVLELSYWTRL